jgi:hypothetical protein
VYSAYGTVVPGMNYVKNIVNIFGIGRRLVATNASAVKAVGGC